MAEESRMVEGARKRRVTHTGIVAKDASNKTVLVKVERRVKHPLYKKIIRRTTKLMAHDETNRCRAGDRVQIEETRPMSKRKRWRVRRIVRASSRRGEATS